MITWDCEDTLRIQMQWKGNKTCIFSFDTELESFLKSIKGAQNKDKWMKNAWMSYHPFDHFLNQTFSFLFDFIMYSIRILRSQKYIFFQFYAQHTSNTQWSKFDMFSMCIYLIFSRSLSFECSLYPPSCLNFPEQMWWFRRMCGSLEQKNSGAVEKQKNKGRQEQLQGKKSRLKINVK